VPSRRYLCFGIHGPSAACHELHPGAVAFVDVMRSIAEARGQGRRVFVASWLTRSNCRSLVELGDRLVAEGVAGWAVVWPRMVPRRLEVAPRTVPRLGIAVPHALRAVQRAERRGLSTALVGVPLCALGPFAAQRTTQAEVGRYPAPCEACSSRAECPGIDAWYLDRFGAAELHSVELVPRVARDPECAEGLGAAARSLEVEP